MNNKLIPESLNLILENPNEISLPGLHYNKFGEPIHNQEEVSPHYRDDDAYPFWVQDGEVKMRGAGSTHPLDTKTLRWVGGYNGRLWLDSKFISFWDYPDEKTFKDIANQLSIKLSNELNIDINILKDPEWVVEILPFDGEGTWHYDDDFQTGLVIAKDYKGSNKRGDIELGIDHSKSPNDPTKKKREITNTMSSKKQVREKPLAWRQALIPESLEEALNFERGQDPKKSMGIGAEAIKEKVKELINFKIAESPLYHTKYINLDERALIDLWESHEMRPGIISFLKEISNYPKKYRSKLSYRWVPFLELLRDAGVLRDPKKGWVNSVNRTIVDEIDPEGAKNEDLTPNQVFSAGLQGQKYETMRKAAFAGATNVHSGNQEILNMAGLKGDVELIKLLLKNPNIDPTLNTKDGKRHHFDDRDYPLRSAAKNGHIEAVKVFLEDGRSDPSSRNNFAIKMAINNGDKDMVELLYADPRVKESMDLLPKTVQNRFNNLMNESISFDRGGDPKKSLRVGKEGIKGYKCGNCGNPTDEYANSLDPDDPEYERTLNLDDEFIELLYCDDCHNEDYNREAEEDEKRWRREMDQKQEDEIRWREENEPY